MKDCLVFASRIRYASLLTKCINPAGVMVMSQRQKVDLSVMIGYSVPCEHWPPPHHVSPAVHNLMPENQWNLEELLTFSPPILQ